jgi:aminopeptidase N
VTRFRAAIGAAWLLVAPWPAAADRLPADVAPLHYQLVVTPEFGTRTFEGDLVIDLRIEKPTNAITLNAVDLEIYRAELSLPSGRTLRPAVSVDAAGQVVTFGMPERLYPGTAKLRLRFGGQLRNDGRGFYLVTAYGRKYALSQMEATNARRAFPCFDEPGFKASFAISAVVGERLTALSNGTLVSDTPGPDFGKHTLRFGTTPKMSSYLVALAVGEFQCIEGSAASVPLRVCAVPEKKGLGRFVLDVAEQVLRADSQYFTLRYPFRKLDLVAIPGGFPGAMENTAAIFFDEGMLVDPSTATEATLAEVAEVISHEIAHQWLGDVVTMKWWDDLWLNEGLATWLAPKALQAWRPQWRFDLSAVARTNAAMRLDALRSTRAVRATVATEAEIDESFDHIAYDKAAAVLGMVEAWIGPDAFRAGLNAFVRARAYEPATGEDLWGHLAAASGNPVDRVMMPAVTKPGIPVVEIEASCDGDQTAVAVTQRRFSAGPANVEPDTGTWQIPLGIRGVGEYAPTLTSTTVLLTEPRHVFMIAGCYPAVIANAGAAGYFYSAYQPEAFARLAALARQRLTPAERVRLIEDAWALAGSRAEGIGNYLTLVSALADDPTPEVIEEIAAGLMVIEDELVSDKARPSFEAWVIRTFSPAASGFDWRVAPGETSDRQRLRKAVMAILGGAGRDPAVLATARVLAAAHLAGALRLDPSLVDLVTGLAARTADASLLGRLQALDAREAVAHAGDPLFVTRTLDAALADEAPPGDAAELLEAALGNPAVKSQAWQFVKSRWTDIQPKLSAAFALPSVVAATGAFCDGAARDDVERFFADKAGAAPRTLRLALDRVDACRNRRLWLDGPLTEWLNARQFAPEP